MPMTIKPVTPAVGAEISGVNLAHLSDAEFSAIEQAWNRHSALLFRDRGPGVFVQIDRNEETHDLWDGLQAVPRSSNRRDVNSMA